MRLALRVLVGVALWSGLASAPHGVVAQSPVGRFTAFAVATDGAGPTGAGPVEIVITRWASEPDYDRLNDVLFGEGPSKLQRLMRDMPRAGWLQQPSKPGLDLQFACRTGSADGAERILLMTARPPGYWAIEPSADLDEFPFTVIELHIGPDGKGVGQLSMATRIGVSKTTRTIEFQSYTSHPVSLQDVQRKAK